MLYMQPMNNTKYCIYMGNLYLFFLDVKYFLKFFALKKMVE